MCTSGKLFATPLTRHQVRGSLRLLTIPLRFIFCSSFQKGSVFRSCIASLNEAVRLVPGVDGLLVGKALENRSFARAIRRRFSLTVTLPDGAAIWLSSIGPIGSTMKPAPRTEPYGYDSAVPLFLFGKGSRWGVPGKRRISRLHWRFWRVSRCRERTDAYWLKRCRTACTQPRPLRAAELLVTKNLHCRRYSQYKIAFPSPTQGSQFPCSA
jgi:hypothetical protein